jgi:hypothetical protein
VFTVGVDQGGVEARLAAGEFSCPCCGGRLARWGFARPRRVRGVGRLTPRRARCVAPGCGVTQVLLPVSCLARRADGVVVIGAAVELAASGVGCRRVAVAVGRPVATVRGWLARLGGRAVRVRAALGVLVRAVAGDPPRLVDVVCPLAGVVGMIAAFAVAVAGRWSVAVLSRWELVAFVTGGGLLAPSFVPESINTSPRLPTG